MILPSLSVAAQGKAPLNIPRPSVRQDPSACEAASRVLHLADVADGQHTLCGLPLSRVLTGGYCEHLDGNLDDPQFERAIFVRDGREAESCEECLNRQPAVLTSSMDGAQ